MKQKILLFSLIITLSAAFTVEAQTMATLEITCNEVGASVFINGKLVGYTRPTFVQAMPTGTYTVRIEKKGFNTWEQSLLVSGKTVRARVNLSPSGGAAAGGGQLGAPKILGQTPTKYRYTINSNVSGATVFINNSLRGKTPLTIELEEGSYNVMVQAPGYKSHSYKINLSRSEEYYAQLQANTYNLHVRSNVSGAEVILNGAVVGRTPYRADVAGGNYRVQVRAPGFSPWESNIALNSTTTLDATLLPMRGKVEVIIPSSLMDRNNRRDVFQLYVNGAPQSALQVDLDPGRHTIKVVSGALSVERIVTVEAGKTYRLELSASLNLR